jgi:long-chain fatty acid transport protein
MRQRVWLACLYCVFSSGVQAAGAPWPTMTGLTAAADSALTVQSNPAGMARLTGSEFIGQVALIATQSDDRTSVSGLGLTGEQDDSSVIGVPLFYYVRPLSEKVNFGLSLAVPGGFGDEYGSDSPSRYLVEEWSLVYLSLVPAVSYRFSEQWSVGAAIPLNYARFDLENAVFNAEAADGRMEVDADAVAASFNLGVLFETSDKTRFGLSYRSEVKMDLEGSPDFSDLSTQTRDLLETSGALAAEVEIGSNLPPVISVGAYHEFANGWGGALDIGQIQWSKFVLTEFGYFDGERVERVTDYDDALAASMGVSIPVNDRWTLGFGVAYMDTPVDDDSRAMNFRMDKTWLVGAGVEHDRGDGRSITANLSFMDLGDGVVKSEPIPVLGTVEAEYEEHWGVLLDLQFRWGS